MTANAASRFDQHVCLQQWSNWRTRQEASLDDELDQLVNHGVCLLDAASFAP